MQSIKELAEKRAQLWQAMKELNELTKTEQRTFTAEEEQSWDRMNSDLEKCEKDIADAEKAETRSKFLADKERELNASRGRKATPDAPGVTQNTDDEPSLEEK